MRHGNKIVIVGAALLVATVAACGSSGASAQQVNNCKRDVAVALMAYDSEWTADLSNSVQGLEAMPKLFGQEQHTWSNVGKVPGCAPLDSQQLTQVKHKLGNAYSTLRSQQASYINQLP
jgi:uncharacterized lipoprotein